MITASKISSQPAAVREIGATALGYTDERSDGSADSLDGPRPGEGREIEGSGPGRRSIRILRLTTPETGPRSRPI
jgi:hypothetical protein